MKKQDQPERDGLQPTSDGLRPASNGLQLNSNGPSLPTLVAMASQPKVDGLHPLRKTWFKTNISQ